MFKFSDVSDMCIKCGKCIPGCTIHRVNPDEATSPRGFLDILKGVEEGEIEIDKTFKDTVESCFLCNQCVEVCPNSLPTDFMIENARNLVAKKFGIAPWKKAFFFMLRHRWAYDLISKLGFYFQSCGFKIEEKKKSIRSRFSLPMLERGRLLPAFRKKTFLKKYPEEIKVSGKRRVAIFIGCLANYNYTEVGDALVKILKFLDIDIFIPKKQACCGAPAYFTGDFDTTEYLIKKNIEYFESFIDEVEAILVPEATCTAMLRKDYEEYIHHHMDEEWLKRYKKIQNKIFGTTEWLYKHTDLEKRLEEKNKKITTLTYHDACHFGKVFNIREEPRSLLNKVATINEMEDPDVCCGFGGITIQSEKFHLARKEGLIKAEMIKKVDAEVVSAECSACRMQITEHLDKVGDNKLFKHPLEIIAKAIDD
ncbi:(Fe-S)-binding protein [Caminibacter sp.]